MRKLIINNSVIMEKDFLYQKYKMRITNVKFDYFIFESYQVFTLLKYALFKQKLYSGKISNILLLYVKKIITNFKYKNIFKY